MKPFAFAALAVAALSLTGCGENLGAGQPLNVVSGHIVMGATPDRPSVGYFRVERSEEHTSELQSLMRSSYTVFCLKQNTEITTNHTSISVQDNTNDTQYRF